MNDKAPLSSLSFFAYKTSLTSYQILSAVRGSTTHGWKSEEGDAEKGAAGGDDLSLPSDRDGVAIAHGAQGYLHHRSKVQQGKQFGVTCSLTHQSPPEGISKTPEHFVFVLLNEVDEEGGEDEAEEANVDGRDQLLR